MRILSGIQPSGALHIGNYFGAIRQYIDLQQENDAYYFVADYHALTSVRDAAQLRAYAFDVIVTMLSLGLDPEKATLFVQSDVPETTELAWLLTTVTPMGWLEKCVSYKDKVQQGLSAEHGLFAYPVLQAADILLYDADLVPVGQDQKQHLEITRDIAERFNRVYGGGEDVFRLPKPYILESVAVVPGLDGRKMSKSYNNTIEIFDEPGDDPQEGQEDRHRQHARRGPQEPRDLLAVQPVQAVRRRRTSWPRSSGDTAKGGSATARSRPGWPRRSSPGSPRHASSGPTGWPIPSASPRSAPPPPRGRERRPASCSTGPARPAEWVMRSPRSTNGHLGMVFSSSVATCIGQSHLKQAGLRDAEPSL